MFICDFHIHSKYSRATSPDMDIPQLAKMARIKGINLIGTGDFTHPLWLGELKKWLVQEEDGLYRFDTTLFLLTSEVSNIFYKKGEVRKIHNIIFAPDFEAVEKINRRLGELTDLSSDGRPTLNLEAEKLLELVLEESPESFIVPAHVWTPWFSLFGSNSGFDSVEECFGKFSSRIFSLETGLSSDPQMCWRLSSLDRFCLISNSDAHSPARLGREANVFSQRIGFYELKKVLKKQDGEKFLFTIEFFPQEGKYHFDGHRRCGVRLPPRESIKNNNLCPKCGQPITVGVMHRVESLADREEGYVPSGRIPFRRLVPLQEIIAEAMNQGRDTRGVEETYRMLCQRMGGELRVLLDVPLEELSTCISSRVVEGIRKVRGEKVRINPGYDGVYGEVRVFEEEEKKEDQLSLF